MGLRCFIAVELPDEIKNGITTYADQLKMTGADVKWVAGGHIHITLKFLGDTEETLLPSITEALQKKISPYAPFYITISELGCFPDRKRPRVLWVGIRDAMSLVNLNEDIEAEMVRFGFQPEKRGFSPHITIGRIRSMKRIAELLRKLDELGNLSFDKLLINRISLIKSDLKPAGAEYTTLAEIPFSRRGDVQ